MQTIRINLNGDRTVIAGIFGENEFRVLKIIPPKKLRKADFFIARFSTPNGPVPSETLVLEEGVLTLPLWQQVTSQGSANMTLEGYIGETVIGKSHMVTLKFGEAVTGSGIPKENAPTLENEIHANTAARHTHENKAVLDELGETEDGNLTYKGMFIGGGSGGTLDHRYLLNRDAENQHPASAISGLENVKIDGGIW